MDIKRGNRTRRHGTRLARTAARRLSALAVITLTLSGCAALNPPPYAELSRAQTSEDHLPNGIPGEHGVDGDSVRFVGEYDGLLFWLAKSTELSSPDAICLIVQVSEDVAQGSAGCSGGTNVSMTWPTGAAKYKGPGRIPDSAIADGWVRISDNVILRHESE